MTYRWHVANNPGKPGKAFVGHLLYGSGAQEAS